MSPIYNSITGKEPLEGFLFLQGSGWQPTDLPNLIGWWDASDISTIEEADNAGRVSQINDKSGNTNHLIASSALNQPQTGVNSINGLNVMDFGILIAGYLSIDGNLADTTNLLDAQNCHVSIVFQNKGTTNAQRQGALIQVKSSNGSDLINDNFAGTGKPYFPENTGGATSYLTGSNGDFPLDTPHLLSFDGDGSDMIAYSNGTQIAATGSGAASDHFDRFVVGYRTSANRAYTGYIAEIVVSQSLNTADRQDLEGYLANKWGIA